MSEDKTFSYASPLPYPEIKATAPNGVYGRWMLDNMSGMNSEMTTIASYVYNNVLLSEQYQDIAHIFHKISIVEMHHLDCFAKMALALGENPRFCYYRNGRRHQWSSANCAFMMPLDRMVYHALNEERNAIRKYEEQIRNTRDECVASVLTRIADDERIHVAIFEKLIEEYRL